MNFSESRFFVDFRRFWIVTFSSQVYIYNSDKTYLRPLYISDAKRIGLSFLLLNLVKQMKHICTSNKADVYYA